jgi:hypothetical protein
MLEIFEKDHVVVDPPTSHKPSLCGVDEEGNDVFEPMGKCPG